jgi:mono/diheme cytochrome c family protein
MIGASRQWIGILALGAVFVVAGCGDSDGAPGADRDAEPGLTAFQLEHGIGPITEEVVLGEPDEQVAREGEEIFQFNCEACHRMEQRFVGPPLGDVMDRRSPAFVMNFILNPEQMARQHPEGQKLLAEYPLVMPFQNISEDQARAILEYLRTR